MTASAEYLDGARYVLGTVDQTLLVDGDVDVLSTSWAGSTYASTGYRASREVIMSLWRTANEHALLGCGPVLWSGHDLEQLAWLHHCLSLVDGTPCHGPTSWPMVVAGSADPDDTDHYFCLLGGDTSQRNRFSEWFGGLGIYSRPRHLLTYRRNLAREIQGALRARGPMSKRAIARVIQARKSAVSAIVDRLARAGRISRATGWAWQCCTESHARKEARE